MAAPNPRIFAQTEGKFHKFYDIGDPRNPVLVHTMLAHPRFDDSHLKSYLDFTCRVKTWLEGRGYSVIINADNRGLADLVAMSTTENLLIKCKLNRKISKLEETEVLKLRTMFPSMNVLFAMPARVPKRGIQIKYPWGDSVHVSNGETVIEGRAARKVDRDGKLGWMPQIKR